MIQKARKSTESIWLTCFCCSCRLLYAYIPYLHFFYSSDRVFWYWLGAHCALVCTSNVHHTIAMVAFTFFGWPIIVGEKKLVAVTVIVYSVTTRFVCFFIHFKEGDYKEGKRRAKNMIWMSNFAIHNIDMPGIGFKESFYFQFLLSQSKCTAMRHIAYKTYRRRHRHPSALSAAIHFVCFSVFLLLLIFDSVLCVGFSQLKHDNYMCIWN